MLISLWSWKKTVFGDVLTLLGQCFLSVYDFLLFLFTYLCLCIKILVVLVS